jgi:hypothetical protein
MSKTELFMTVTIDITRSQVQQHATDYVVDDWYEDYGKDVFEGLLGMTRKDFANELMELPAFHTMIRKAVIEMGKVSLYDVYDYMDFDIFNGSKEMKCLRNTLNFLQEILEDVYNEKNDDCADAIATLKRAGYKIVRA